MTLERGFFLVGIPGLNEAAAGGRTEKIKKTPYGAEYSSGAGDGNRTHVVSLEG